MSQAVAPPRPSIEDHAARLDETQGRLTGLDPAAREVLSDHLEALNALHADALRILVRTLRDDPRGKELLFELVDDPVVHMVLAMHGIVRPDPVTAAEAVLRDVRPGLQSHGGDVELVRIEESTAYVRLRGACNGCSMASVTMRGSVEQALVAGVPGLRAVEVVPNDPEPAFVSLDSIGRRPVAERELEEAGWVRAVAASDVPVGGLVARTLRGSLGEVEAIVVNAAGTMAAYVNACAHQGRPLDDALVDADEGTLTCAGHGFCFDATNGECLSMPGAQLESLPLRIEGGQVWVRTGGA